MTKAVKEALVKTILDDRKSKKFIREEEALRLIKQGKLLCLMTSILY